MIIRWAEEKDLERMTDIFNYEVVNSTSSFCLHPRTMEERRGWFDAHDREARPLIVAEVEGSVVGYASLSEFRSYEAYKGTVELSVYVDHRFRRQGIGEKLMERLLELARENESIHAVISVITAENQASLHIHEKLGFVSCGVLRQVGFKFGCWLDAAFYEMVVG